MVQTFLVEETKELIYDVEKLSEWKQKCEDLGLQNQLNLANADKSPIPFECLNEVQRRVYETLCPAKELYTKYNKTAIPLEVLSLIALSEKEGYFNEIYIWFDDKTPDPFAIGYKKELEWNNKYYCIARWAHELMPFEELKEKAIKIFKNNNLINLSRKLVDTQIKVQNIELNTLAYFNGQIENYDVIGF